MKRKKYVASFYRQLAILVEAGYPLIRALEILARRSSKRRNQAMIVRLVASLQRGNAFWESLDQERSYFPATEVQVIRAAEYSGNLPVVLNQLTDSTMRTMVLVKRVRSTMMYPVVVLLFGVGMMIFLSHYIVPTFSQMYAEMDRQLPLPTRIVIGANNMVQDQWLLILVSLGALAAIVWMVGRWNRVRYLIDRLKLRVTLFGPLTKEYIVVHTCGTLAMLLKAGINLVRALELTRDAASNRVVSEGLEQTRIEVTAGRGLEAPLRKAEIFPDVVVDMIATATETGTLDQNLVRAAQIYEQELEDKMRDLAAMVEPMLVAVVGGLVMLVALSLFMPYFDMLTAIATEQQ
jgi:type IV pilus assembly protein PilC